ncbi:MAG: hypothetical protein ACR5K9_00570 [Wolbachia sp.]
MQKEKKQKKKKTTKKHGPPDLPENGNSRFWNISLRGYQAQALNTALGIFFIIDKVRQ